MYEEMTFEAIQEDMLEDMRNDIDKREGSIAWDAVAAVAYKIAEMYFLLENYLDLILPDTAVNEYLDRVCLGYGISRNEATKAERKVTTDGEVAIGSRWQIREIIYATTEKLAENEYLVTCEQSGEIGNQYFGQLQPLDSSSVSASIGEVVKPGTDREEDSALRKRLLAKIQRPSTSGNVNDYYNWTMECEGIGDAKIIPLAAGPGTVKVIVVNSDKEPADTALVKVVREHIETMRPIGATVTVESAEKLTINITAKVVFSGTELQMVQQKYMTAIQQYFKESAFNLEYVGLARMGSILMSIDGVDDYSEMRINSEAKNLKIESNQVAVCGSVQLEVVVNGN